MTPQPFVVMCVLASVAVDAPAAAQDLAVAEPDRAVGPAGGAPGGADVAVSRAELDAVLGEIGRLRAEVASLRSELAMVRSDVPRAAMALAPGATPAAQPPQGSPGVDMLRTQVEELARTRVETRSRMPVRLFGAIVSNTVVNTGMANWLENPNRVRPMVPTGSRQENRSAFGNVIFGLTPEVAMSMEYRWLATEPGRTARTRDNHHVNAAFVVRF